MLAPQRCCAAPHRRGARVWEHTRVPPSVLVCVAGLLTAGCVYPTSGDYSSTLPPGHGPAVDWSLDGIFSQRFEADTNIDLDVDSTGNVYGSRSTFGATLSAATKRSEFSLSAAGEGSAFGGPGDTEGLTRIDPRVEFTANHEGKRHELTGSFRYRTDSSSFTDADVVTTVEDRTVETTIEFEATALRRLSERHGVYVTGFGEAIEFRDPSLAVTPTREFGVAVGWQSALTETTDLEVELGGRSFIADDVENTHSQIIDFLASFTHERTPRHTFGFSVGVTAVRTRDDIEGTDSAIGPTGTVSLGYAIADWTAELAFSQEVDPSTDGGGTLDYVSTVTGGILYDINERQTIGFDGFYSHSRPISGAGDTTDDFSIGPTYTWLITPETTFTLGYRFELSRDGGDGNATGHELFLILERTFNLLP